MLINEVALGNVYDVYQPQTSLKKAPDGYDSVHAVRNQDGNDSHFEVWHAGVQTIPNVSRTRGWYLSRLKRCSFSG